MLKKVNWSSAFSSIILIVLGILVIVSPTFSTYGVVYLIGACGIVYGLISILIYFTLDIAESIFRHDFVNGLSVLILGILIIINKEMVVTLIPMITGMIVIMSGFQKLERCIVSKRIGYNGSSLYVVLAMISVVLGLVIVFFMRNTEDTVSLVVIGCGLVYSGISDLVANFFLASKFNRYVKEFNSKKEEKKKPVKKPVDPNPLIGNDDEFLNNPLQK